MSQTKHPEPVLTPAGETRRGAPILVVDDDATLRGALCRILRHEGHEVLEAPDGPSALDLARDHAVSLVLLDYMMPGMDGEMVLDALRAERGDETPPAVLLTASGRQQERAEEIGAVLGLCKPFRVEELLTTVARYSDAKKRS